MTAANGFKHPAPVLPAMGLHSFHNDSPPFAGAGMPESTEPEYLSLDSSVSNLPPRITRSPLESSHSNGTATPPNEMDHSRSTSSSSYLSQEPPVNKPEREETDPGSARSRRLLSGYMFGNPPSPVGEQNQPLLQAVSETHRAPSPSHSDSPPLTSASSPTFTQRALLPQDDFKQLANVGSSDLARRRSSRSGHRERDSAFDALNGLNDGEADLDESAPQAEGAGTEGYLRGVEGEAGVYNFPRHRLRRTMKDESKIPLVIVACGSFSPPTYLHLRMFEMAKDEIVESQTYEIMAGYYSPVSSYYKKSGLAPALDRVRMCELAVEHTSTWLMVDPWEAGQPEYQRTAVVLDHFDEMLNGSSDDSISPGSGGGVVLSNGQRRRFKVMLLAGGDLIESFGEPGVWSEPDLHIILGRFGCLIVERAGSDVWAFLLSHDILYHHRRNVIVIKQLIYNDISSTKVRLFVRRGMSIKYLLPNSVIQYIHDHKLYREPDMKSITNTK